MGQVLKLGPVSVRLSWAGQAKWGYPLASIGGLDLFTRHSDGALGIASYHSDTSTAWYWSVALTKRPMVAWGWRLWSRDSRRRGQWHDYYRLPFGRALIVSRQDYHLARLPDGGSAF